MSSTEPTQPESGRTEKKIRPDEDVQQAMDMVRRYGPPIAIGFVVAIVIMLIVSFRQQQRAGALADAAQLFMNADSAEAFQRVVDQYPDTPSGPMAMLALAAQRYRDGMVEQARTQYSLFIERYPRHMMRPAAELGLAYCDEAMGQLESALLGFQSFQTAYADHYLTPIARLSEARVLGLLGRIDEARAIYDDMSATAADPVWASQAENDLRYLERALRARAAMQDAPVVALPEEM